jgi:hypothetical protein
MCGWPPACKDFSRDRDDGLLAVMCPACWRGTLWPQALMGTVERGLIIAAGSHCPMTNDRLPSFIGLTDIAITRVHPRKLPGLPAWAG